MSQLPVFVLLHVLGLSVCLAFGPRQRLHLCAALGFTTGLAVMVAIELLMLGTGVPFTVASGSLAALAVIAGCVVRVRHRGGLDRAAALVLVRWTLGFVVVAAALSSKNVAILTYDSHYIVLMAGAIARDASFAPGMLEKMGDYGAFQVLAQSLVGFTRTTFLWGLPPVFAGSTIVLFGVCLDSGLAALGVRLRRRWLAVTLVALTTFSIYMLFRHAVYIHTNFGTAAYLLVFCALFWLAEVEQDTSLLPIAFVALAALALHRIEGPLVCVLFGALTLLPSRLPARAILPGLAAVTVVVTGWYVLLASAMAVDSAFLTPTKCYLLAGVLVAFLGYASISAWPRLRWLRAVNRRMPTLVALVFVAALVAAFKLRFEHMATSLDAWFHCLWLAPYWEGSWLAIVALALVGLLAPAPPVRAAFVVGIPAYMALILLLVWGRDPYYWGLGDSASRMAIHLVPLAFFYFGVKFLPLLGERPVAGEPPHGA